MIGALDLALLIPLATAGVRLAAPLLFAALGGILSERSGVLNIGLEGMMVAGAFGGYVGSYLTDDPWLGLVGGLLAGSVTGLLHAILCVSYRADQVVVGTGINIFAVGITSYFYRAMYSIGIPNQVAGFRAWAVPLLSDIPVLGQILFRHVPIVYLAYFMIPIIGFLLYKTTWGLSLRTVGEHPRAAETVGIPVIRARYLAVTLSGSMAGLGGAFLSIGQLSAFVEGLVAGRGFIALAAMVFGRWDPLKTGLACLLFGTADALQLRLQSLGFAIPYEFLLMFPYLLTLLTFILFVHRANPPAALGKPYPASEE